MGILAWIIGAGVVGKILNDINKVDEEEAERRVEEERRRNTPCRFVDGISESEFKKIVYKAGKRIRRITDISIDGAIVSCTYDSQSGLTEWEFTIDFNDYGHITGEYWLWCENDDSSVPDTMADHISDMIINYSGSVKEKSTTINGYQYDKQNNTNKSVYCPYCGEKQFYEDSQYCFSCGSKL